ncbi:MAG: N-acetylmuramoyl-L-alanine amidase [Arcobacteraceae bacterium]|nr:N-acetylmuramoyl-L-alanine amidase [Arcobacteraceae bacterium]
MFNKNITKKDIRYFTKKGKGNFQYIFDINGRFKDAKPTILIINDIDRVKIVQYRFKTLRISIINKYRLKPIYIIGNKKIIIRVKSIKKRKKKVVYIPSISTKIKRKTIVIDAGHGGKDVGAVGSFRRYEKTVTLNIGKYLYRILKQNGYSVYLTRSRDKYVSLRYRTKLANRKNADMFISIHANAAPKSKVRTGRGIETYFLSPARSARAKRVAAKENKGDMGSMGWSSQSAFLTVLNQGKITASNKMAIDIQKNMLYSLRQRYGAKTIRDGGVREGPFWVLVGAQMPSVLIEVGYISHPSEGKRIYTSKYQKLISKAISNGIDSYFLKNQ